MKRQSWARVRRLKEKDIKRSAEHPEADVRHIVRGIARRGLKAVPAKTSISLRVDADVLKWFKAQEWINAVLRAFKDAQRVRAEYDFSEGKRGALIPTKGKTRITIYVDDVLDEFRARAERAGTGYQTMMNEALKAFLDKNEQPVTAAVLRKIIGEELPEVSRPTRRSNRRAKTARR